MKRISHWQVNPAAIVPGLREHLGARQALWSRFTGFMVCPPPAGLGQPMGQHRSVLGWLFPVPTWKEQQQPLCPAYFSLFLLKSCRIPAPVQREPSQPAWGRDEVPITEGPFPRECSLCSGVGFPHPRVLSQPRSSQSDTDLPLAGYLPWECAAKGVWNCREKSPGPPCIL